MKKLIFAVTALSLSLSLCMLSACGQDVAEGSQEETSSAITSFIWVTPQKDSSSKLPQSTASAPSGEASSAVSNKPSTNQGTLNSVQTILDDMRLLHEGIPHGVGAETGWRDGPRVGWGINPYGFVAFTAWGQVYEDINGNPAKNTRVQIRNMEAYYLTKSTGQWIELQNSSDISGMAYLESFADDKNIQPDKRDESHNGGGLSVTAGNGYNYHFWPSGSRATIDPNDVAGVYTTVQARLILNDPSKPDDRATSRYILSMGGDYWKTLTAQWDYYKTNADYAIGRFKYVTNDWQAFNCFAGDAEALKKNPPPLR